MEKNKNEGTTSKTQLIIAFLIGLLIGVLAGPTFFGDKADIVSEDNDSDIVIPTDNEGESDVTTPTKPTSNSVSVHDQLAGDRIILDNVVVSDSTWVVVHEDIEGFLGNALGAQRFDAGVYTDGYVELLRNTESEKMYYVVLYTDDGDGEFNIKLDTPTTGTNGEIDRITFKTVIVDRKTN